MNRRSIVHPILRLNIGQYIVPILGLAILFLTSWYSFLMFQTLAEFFSVTVCFGLLMLVWNSRRWMNNNYLFILGIGWACSGALDLVRVIALLSPNIFVGYTTDLPVQLWIAARYVQSITLLIAPPPLFFLASYSIFKTRRMWEIGVANLFALSSLFLLATIFLGWFPKSFIEGIGFTFFKIASEFVIILILFVSLGLLWRNRDYFEVSSLWILITSIGTAIIAEFMIGVGFPYGWGTLIGYCFRTANYYLIYLAIVHTGLQRPYELVLRNLEQQEKRYRQMFTEHSAIQLLINIDTGAIVQANPAAARFYGYSVENLEKMNWAQINTLPSEQSTAWMQEASLRTSDHFIFQQRLESGELRDVEVHATPIQVSGRELLYSIIHDITTRKQAEQALRETQEKFYKLFNLGPAAMSLASLQESRYLDVNAEFLRLCGYTRDQVIGHTMDELKLWVNPEQWNLVLESIKEHGTARNIELSVHSQSGQILHQLWSAEIIVINSEPCVLAMSQDITERKRMEEDLAQAIDDLKRSNADLQQTEKVLEKHQHHLEELVKERTATLEAIAIKNAQLYNELKASVREREQTQEQLVRVEKMAALGRLVASLAHEINNPLQALRSGFRLLLKPSMSEKKRREYLEVANKEIERLISIVERVLGFYRPSRGLDQAGPKATNINTIIDETLTLAGKQLEHAHVVVQCQLDDGLPLVTLYEDQLKQVFLNLILNALQSMPEGGELKVSTGLVRNSSEVSITFLDTGIGISHEDLPHIFEPFFTTRTNGTGLGLAITYTLVDRHGGRILVESEVHRGSSFTVILPVQGIIR